MKTQIVGVRKNTDDFFVGADAHIGPTECTSETRNPSANSQLPIDHEAEAAINAYEAEFGADGTRVFRDPAAEQVQPTVQERLEHYRPVVMAAVSEDTAYRNACGHSDRENAEIECNAAVRRAVLNSKDMEFIRLFSDVPEFRNHLHQEVLRNL